MVLRLTLIAHAATEATHACRFAAPSDDLSRAGRGQAKHRAISGSLPGHSVDTRVLRGPELRVEHTARLLGYGDATIAEEFSDLDIGTWSGRQVDDIPAADLYAWNTDPSYCGHGGESIATACNRIGSALDALDRQQWESGVIIAHPSTLRLAVVHCLSAPCQAFFRIDAGPGHALSLHRRSGRWTLRL